MATPTSLPATFVAGNVLTAAQMNDLRGAFRILQVVQTAHSTEFSTTSTSLVDVTGLSVTITPTSATSKVLVMVNASGEKSDSEYLVMSVFRGGAASGTNLGNGLLGFGALKTSAQIRGFLSYCYLDSPATTSATTYNVAARINSGTAGYVMRSDAKNTITALEVSA